MAIGPASMTGFGNLFGQVGQNIQNKYTSDLAYADSIREANLNFQKQTALNRQAAEQKTIAHQRELEKIQERAEVKPMSVTQYDNLLQTTRSNDLLRPAARKLLGITEKMMPNKEFDAGMDEQRKQGQINQMYDLAAQPDKTALIGALLNKDRFWLVTQDDIDQLMMRVAFSPEHIKILENIKQLKQKTETGKQELAALPDKMDADLQLTKDKSSKLQQDIIKSKADIEAANKKLKIDFYKLKQSGKASVEDVRESWMDYNLEIQDMVTKGVNKLIAELESTDDPAQDRNIVLYRLGLITPDEYKSKVPVPNAIKRSFDNSILGKKLDGTPIEDTPEDTPDYGAMYDNIFGKPLVIPEKETTITDTKQQEDLGGDLVDPGLTTDTLDDYFTRNYDSSENLSGINTTPEVFPTVEPVSLPVSGTVRKLATNRITIKGDDGNVYYIKNPKNPEFLKVGDVITAGDVIAEDGNIEILGQKISSKKKATPKSKAQPKTKKSNVVERSGFTIRSK